MGRFKDYMLEGKKGYELSFEEFKKEIAKAEKAKNKKKLKAIHKNLDASFLKANEKDMLMSDVYRLIQSI